MAKAAPTPSPSPIQPQLPARDPLPPVAATVTLQEHIVRLEYFGHLAMYGQGRWQHPVRAPITAEQRDQLIALIHAAYDGLPVTIPNLEEPPTVPARPRKKKKLAIPVAASEASPANESPAAAAPPADGEEPSTVEDPRIAAIAARLSTRPTPPDLHMDHMIVINHQPLSALIAQQLGLAVATRGHGGVKPAGSGWIGMAKVTVEIDTLQGPPAGIHPIDLSKMIAPGRGMQFRATK